MLAIGPEYDRRWLIGIHLYSRREYLSSGFQACNFPVITSGIFVSLGYK